MKFLTKEQLEKRQYTASRELEDVVKDYIETMQENDVVLHLAYTDYGGSTLDQSLIEYLRKNYKSELDNTIHVEYTHYYGQNCFVFGELAKRIQEENENYPLGFEDIEDFHFEMESKAIQKDVTYLRKSLRDKYVITKNSIERMEELARDGNFLYHNSFESVDYSESNLIDLFLEEGLIKPRKSL